MFTANVVVSEFVAIADGSFPVRVTVDYTFGKTMHGLAVVSFKRFSRQVVFEKTLELGTNNGLFEVSIANDLGITREESVDIDLVFIDSMSDKKINASAYTMIRNISTHLSLDIPQTFKRDQLLSFVISASRFDGTPVSWAFQFQ